MMEAPSQKDEVKLKESDNVWCPTCCQPMDLTEEEIKTQAFYKKVQGILNRLTSENLGTVVEQVKALPIDSPKRLQVVMDLVFEKAVDGSPLLKEWTKMCCMLRYLEVPDQTPNEGSQMPRSDAYTLAALTSADQLPKPAGMASFRSLLIARCQMEFEKDKAAELDADKKLAVIEATEDYEKRKELQLLFEDHKRRIQAKSIRLVRFLGELFNLNMLPLGIMHRCVKKLIDRKDEESLECLCHFLMVMGKELESQSYFSEFRKDWESYFDMMRKLTQNEEGSTVSSRVKHMLQEVITVRDVGWVHPRD